MFKQSIGKIILITALACGVSSLANATVPGPYIGGQFGHGNTDYEWGELSNIFTFGTTTETADSSGPAGRFFGGYQFNQYFALELGYTQFSTAHIAYTYNLFGLTTTYSGSVKQNAVDLMAKGILPITDSFNVYGKLGAAYVTAETTYIPNDTFMTGETYHEVLPAGAIGMSYDITPNLPIDISYMHIQHGGDFTYSSEFVSVGLSYHFDM